MDLEPPRLAERTWIEGRTRLVRFLRSRGAAEEDAEDIVHDILLKAIERGEATGVGSGNLPAWLHRAATNALVDRSRREQTRRRNTPNVEPAFDPRAVPQSREALYECLEPFLAMLGEADRAVLLMVDRDGLPQAEVAARLGISVSGAKSRVQRARRRLRAIFEKCCAFVQDTRAGIVAYEPRRRCEGDCETGQNKRPRA